MYVGGLVLVAGLPLALGSLEGVVTFVPFATYRQRTRYRLIPHVWQSAAARAAKRSKP